MENENKDLVQSFKMTTIRNGFGIYGQRTIIRLVEASQQFLQGKKIGDCITYQFEKSLWDEVRIKMPITAILAKDDVSNHLEAKKQLKKLVTTAMEYQAPNGDWVVTTLISKVVFSKSTGEASLTIQPEIWEAILDFSKGFRRFELNKALELKSAYSVRLYELLSGQEKPLSYKLTELKKMLGVEKKYDRPFNFIARVIEPAKEELDRLAPYSFDFKPILERKSSRGKPTIVGITFIPYFQPKKRDKALAEKADFDNIRYKYPNIVDIPQGIKNYLMQCFEFTETGIKNNQDLLSRANKHLDLDKFLRKIVTNARKAKNPQGYVIRAIKSELKENGINL